MTGRLSVGSIGAGFFASFHLDAWSRLEGASLDALCDRDPEALARAAARHTIGSLHTDIDRFFDAGPFDIVDIVVPPAAHEALIERAVQAARLVICQKPFCASLEEAMQATALAEARSVPLVVHENFRFQPWYEILHGLLKGGAVGTPYQATFRLRPGDGQGPDAYLDRQPYFQTMDRFLVHETAIHFIDVFRYLFGEPSAVFADLRRLNPAIAGEDAGLVLMRYDSGFRAVFDGNRLADHAAHNPRRTMGEFLIEGSEATLRLDGDGRLWRRTHGSYGDSAIPCAFPKAGFGGDCVYRLQHHVLEAMTSGTPLANTARSYLGNLEIEAAVYRSQDEERWIDLSR
ncbi:MAG: Gfo/Idh/MocA family oxidoreductase [Pseudomonadota bacterium]